MTSPWMAHGHIRNQDLEESYQNAKASIDSSGNIPKEFHSVHLMEDLCNLSWFPRPDFKTNSQVPPSDTKGPNKACDLATQSIDNNHKWHLFCFHEGKRAINSTDSKIRALEDQAQGYCKEYMEAHEGVEVVYANTFVGTYVRFWACEQGDFQLRGFWNGDEKDRFDHYRDVGLDEHFDDIQRALNSIKSIPSSVLRRGQDHSIIGASYSPAAPATAIASTAYSAAYSVPMGTASSSQATTSTAYPAGLGG